MGFIPKINVEVTAMVSTAHISYHISRGFKQMLNRTILIGRLTRDPELRYTPSGVAVTQFTLAVDRPFKKAEGAEREADFIPVVTWRQLAETCAKFLKKGRLTAVEGRIQVRSYLPDNSDKRVYMTEVIADNVRFLENPKDGDSKPGRDPFKDDGEPIEISDEDLPF